MVGYNTVKNDDPQLTVRFIKGNNPIRIVLDDKKVLNSTYKVFNNDSKTFIINNYLKQNNPSKFICEELYKNKIQSVIIEGGKKTLDIFIKSNCWDEARIFESNGELKEGIISPELKGELKNTVKIGRDYLKIFNPF
jgi:diaminohydroxyphosphoribosylaminopyrimidine deaminase/5-amino-6-(5-phosphoribosylamino)uracil reductase